METFQGFSTEVFKLWLEIYSGNESSVEDIGEKYKIHITQPLMKLYNKILPSLQLISNDFDLAPSRCLSSPYMDMRFSRGQKYKNYIYLRFRQWGKEKNICGLYFDMGSEYYSYGLRIYKQTSEGMRIVNEKILNNIEHFSRLIDLVEEHGFEIYGENYKRDHFPNLMNSNVKKILNKKNFYIGKKVKLNKSVFSANLADEVIDGFFCVSEIYKLLKD